MANPRVVRSRQGAKRPAPLTANHRQTSTSTSRADCPRTSAATAMRNRATDKPPIADSRRLCNKSVLPQIDTSGRLMTGHLHDLPAPRPTCVRVFLSSTFSDYKAERDVLVKEAVPKLKEFCARLQLDFDVVDLRWGVSDSAVNDHSVQAVCAAQVAACQRQSSGPNFVALLGQRSGSRPLPAYIAAAEYDTLRALAGQLADPDTPLMDVWYRRDDNAVPPVYVLQEVSSQFAHFGDGEDSDLRAADQARWAAVTSRLQAALCRVMAVACQRRLVTDERKHFYITSVTQQEVDAGILKTTSRDAQTLVFVRRLEGLDDVTAQVGVDTYCDQTSRSGQTAPAAHAPPSVVQLADETIPSLLTADNIRRYTVAWRDGGISVQHAEHAAYLAQFCADFVSRMEKLITTCKRANDEGRRALYRRRVVAVSPPGRTATDDPPLAAAFLLGRGALRSLIAEHEQAAAGDSVGTDRDVAALHDEVLHHLTLGRNLSAGFCGRRQELAAIEAYVRDAPPVTPQSNARDAPSGPRPLVVEGDAGAGKSVLLAQCVVSAGEWLGPRRVVVVRFLCTSLASSSVHGVVAGVCRQICAAYSEPVERRQLRRPESTRRYLRQLLSFVSVRYGSAKPLLLLLDSVDQLAAVDGDILSWLPPSLPPHVRVVVSTRLAACPARGGGWPGVSLGALTAADVAGRVDAHLERRGRRLQAEQRRHLLTELGESPQPLRTQLALSTAGGWRSYSALEPVAANTEAAVRGLFGRLEAALGERFVRAALGYLSAGLGGLSVVELEDALSCDDDVLAEAYRYHDPPVAGVVRVPPLLWARLHFELREFVDERYTHAKTLLSWRYRQFAEAVFAMFAHDVEALHSRLADVFLAVAPVRKTVVLPHRDMSVVDADRMVTLQPLVATNVRLLSALPYHLGHARRAEHLKLHTYCHLPFLVAALQASTPSDFLAEFRRTIRLSPDAELQLVYDCLTLSADHLPSSGGAAALCVQLIGALGRFADVHAAIARLCSQARRLLEGLPTATLCPVAGAIAPPAAGHTEPVWYSSGPTDIVASTADQSVLLVAYPHPSPRYRLLTADTRTASKPLPFPKAAPRALSSHHCCFSADQRRLAVSCGATFHVFRTSDVTLLHHGTTDVGGGARRQSGARRLSEAVAISARGDFIALAGQGRLAMLGEKTPSEGSPRGGVPGFGESKTRYSLRGIMNLTGVVETSNLLFVDDDEACTVSTHAVRAESGAQAGAVVAWRLSAQRLQCRVALPTRVAPGLLRLLHHAAPCRAVCVCSHQVFLVDMCQGAILAQAPHPLSFSAPDGSPLLGFHSLAGFLALAHSASDRLYVWRVEHSSLTPLGDASVDANVTAIATAADDVILIGDGRGGIHAMQCDCRVTQLRHVAAAHAQAVNGLAWDADQVLSCCRDERLLKAWRTDDVISPQEPTPPGGSHPHHSVAAAAGTKLEDENVSCVDDNSSSEVMLTGSTSGVSLWALDSGSGRRVITDSPAKKATFVSSLRVVLVLNDHDAKLDLWQLDASSEDYTKGDAHLKLNTAENQPTDVIDFVLSADESCAWIICRKNDFLNIVLYDIETRSTKSNVTVENGSVNAEIVCLLQNASWMVLRCPSSETRCGCVSWVMSAVRLSDGSVKRCATDDALTFSVCQFSADSVLLGGVGMATVWCPDSDAQSPDGPLRHMITVSNTKITWAETTPITVVRRCGDVIVTAGDDGSATVWRINERQVAARHLLAKLHRAAITSMEICCRQRHLLSGSTDRTVRVTDIENGVTVFVLSLHSPVARLQLSSNQRLLFVQTRNAQQYRLLVLKLLKFG